MLIWKWCDSLESIIILYFILIAGTIEKLALAEIHAWEMKFKFLKLIVVLEQMPLAQMGVEILFLGRRQFFAATK